MTLQAAAGLEQALQRAVAPAVHGATMLVRALAVGLLARGHVLLEGPPGLGKTRIARSVAAALGAQFRRVQGTSDLQPADITGVDVFDASRSSFVFHPGPIFADVLLFDEINRAGPRTQSALLEAMQERQVTLERETRALAPDFLVIATQNPREFAGTFPLPESQLDRFLLRVEVPYPEREHERAILLHAGAEFAAPAPAVARIDRAQLEAARAELSRVHVAPEIVDYVLDIAAASRATAQIALGLSTRGALALLVTARVLAALRGGEFVVPDDVKAAAPWVVEHRLLLDAEALAEGFDARAALAALIESAPVPR